ncbi:hypothetical protein LINPERPRIM_LOCUS37841 [Linum perenne]
MCYLMTIVRQWLVILALLSSFTMPIRM